MIKESILTTSLKWKNQIKKCFLSLITMILIYNKYDIVNMKVLSVAIPGDVIIEMFFCFVVFWGEVYQIFYNKYRLI